MCFVIDDQHCLIMLSRVFFSSSSYFSSSSSSFFILSSPSSFRFFLYIYYAFQFCIWGGFLSVQTSVSLHSFVFLEGFFCSFVSICSILFLSVCFCFISLDTYLYFNEKEWKSRCGFGWERKLGGPGRSC